MNVTELGVEVGKGPLIKFSEQDAGTAQNVSHPVIRDLLMETAEAEGIPIQLSAGMEGVSDLATIQQSRQGIPACSLSIPRRYSHSPIEVVDLTDVQHLIDLLVATIAQIKSGFSLQRV